ncbi:hypothetical protein B0H10DRAFT_696242 [Mycena sp. CBHHK59/15]|nr:hypothetical protein B0H10DRAFT_696242 [Mycena sp. CBHHK59/15]
MCSSMLAQIGLALVLALSVSAQATTLPQCALGCARAAATAVKCNLSDTACLCKTSFASTVIQCSATTSCSASEQTQVSSILTQMCAASSGSSSGSASGTPSGSKSASATSTTTAVSTTPSLTRTTATVTQSSPPLTTTFTTEVPIGSSSSFIVPPLSSASPASVPPSSTVTVPVSSTVSVAPAASSPGAATEGARARLAGVAGAVLGVGLWVL